MICFCTQLIRIFAHSCILQILLMKQILYAIAAAAVALGIASCAKSATQPEQNATLCVDSLMTEAPALLGDTVTVEGLCSHLCSHGGRKAFLAGTDTTVILRCEATAEMGGAFGPDCAGKTIEVRGIVRENRINEEQIAQMEKMYAAADTATKTHEACATDKKAQGQDSIDSFEARMADYRAKIAARSEAEGKNYLSFYYLEAISYSIPDKK